MKPTQTKIIPAVLAADEKELKLQLNRVQSLSDEIHIDYGDGRFVNEKTVDWQILLDLAHYYHEKKLEIHIMAEDPLALVQTALEAGFKRVVAHCEALGGKDRGEIKKLSELGEIGLAIKPNSSLDLLNSYLEYVCQVTVMTVAPGTQGRPFNKKGLGKISALFQKGFAKDIEVDGGINKETIVRASRAKANRLVVGSALTRSLDPQKSYNELLALLKNG